MKRLWIASIVPLASYLALGPSALAQSYVAAVGDYYKERSTRVMAPSIQTQVELPDEWRVGGRFLVDQITSASGAFTATDEPFTERRYEIAGNFDKRIGDLRPGLSARFSDETDYTSVGVAGTTTLFLADDLAAITGSFSYTHDWVGRRTSDQSEGARQQGADQFSDQLRTVYLGLDGSHTLSPSLRVGGSFKVRIKRGFMENVYRVEQHPRAQEEYSLGLYARYRHAPSRIGFNLDLCLHASTWGHVAVSPQLEVYWTAARWLEVIPMLRVYVQPNGAFFDQRAERPDPNDPDGDPLVFTTQDPTLTAHRIVQVGLKLAFRPWATGPRIVPAYYFRHQSYEIDRFGDAHIAQVGLYWPFSL